MQELDVRLNERLALEKAKYATTTKAAVDPKKKKRTEFSF